ncbi:Hsp20/alpha crystallin family protein [Acidihalobacter ferrooxydans]|uniref:Heat-shock protein Hsp20 n=1 Tax=Acidihalobacter ferrooxydans TaxID=1765967 RepID=A0A1P8UJN5_9GAMM|nr:Hsp20/alpha crystallin family protein [Acidihalobacter ferrooxydans]APZ44030.1 heat-shock protein Hsp20 [Acidihalobacter ferrooxydans]
MSMVRYQPFGVLNQLYREMDRAFGLPDHANDDAATSDWVPAVDIKEEENAFLIHADVPGVEPKDIEVHMENGVLTIRGERKFENEEEKDGYKRVERVRGSFYRRFTLPDTADAENISARVDKGVLELRIPKQERVRPRRINVEG